MPFTAHPFAFGRRGMKFAVRNDDARGDAHVPLAPSKPNVAALRTVIGTPFANARP